MFSKVLNFTSNVYQKYIFAKVIKIYIFQVELSQLLLCVSQFHSIGQYKVYQVYKIFDNNFQKISKTN